MAAGNQLRTVFDCNVLLQAMANPLGPAGGCLHAARTGMVELYLCPEIVQEFEDVAARPKLVERLAISPAIVVSFVENLLSFSTMVESAPTVFNLPSDPKDEVYVNLAIQIRGHVIATRDRHLLALRDSSDPLGQVFRVKYGEIEILTPYELISRLQTT